MEWKGSRTSVGYQGSSTGNYIKKNIGEAPEASDGQYDDFQSETLSLRRTILAYRELRENNSHQKEMLQEDYYELTYPYNAYWKLAKLTQQATVIHSEREK